MCIFLPALRVSKVLTKNSYSLPINFTKMTPIDADWTTLLGKSIFEFIYAAIVVRFVLSNVSKCILLKFNNKNSALKLQNKRIYR